VAVDNFAEIVTDRPSFLLMTKHLGLEGINEFTSSQKLLLYREYKKLRGAITLQKEGDKFRFGLGVPKEPSAPAASSGFIKGFTIVGLIDQQGSIVILERVPVVLGCPI